MDILRLTGELVAIGDLTRADEVLPLVGKPRLLLRMPDGRTVLLAGLTQDECRACAGAFLAPATIVLRAA